MDGTETALRGQRRCWDPFCCAFLLGENFRMRSREGMDEVGVLALDTIVVSLGLFPCHPLMGRGRTW
jgi:hypothetical protein